MVLGLRCANSDLRALSEVGWLHSGTWQLKPTLQPARRGLTLAALQDRKAEILRIAAGYGRTR